MNRELQRIRRALTRRVWQASARGRAQRAGVLLGPENWCVRPDLPCEVAVDVGVGKVPTFAPWVQAQLGAQVVLCDPTPKHQGGLRAWVARTPGTFLLDRAVAPDDGVASFYESELEESGSIAEGHVNRRGPGRLVEVPAISLDSLIDAAAGLGRVGLVKLDIEGAEFDLFRDLNRIASTLTRVAQWMLEFHPVPQTNRSLDEVYAICKALKKKGFESFSRNGVDFLLWRPMEGR